MARKVFYSFHYKPDCQRAAQVRNAGVVEGNAPVSDNDWESITKGGDPAISAWIDGQMLGKSCAVVLIGNGTAGRKWINYEIKKAWDDGKGVVGVYIHNLKNLDGEQELQGNSPFSTFTICDGTKQLASIVKAYNPNASDSKRVYEIITSNLETWVDEAISIRNAFKC
jgi:hypothetical protein